MKLIYPIVTTAFSRFFPLAAQITQIDRQPITTTSAADGTGMYNTYCATCHGLKGKGDGPASQALKVGIPDLTQLTRNNAGVFPAAAVFVTLHLTNGGAHGSQDMPIWGNVFRESGQGHAIIHQRAYNLTRYIESLQDPAPTLPPKAQEPERRTTRISDIRATFGGDMYRAYCSSCHGADGRGTGPAASALKSVPTDLTRLRDQSGTFPELKIYNLLTLPSTKPIHGTKDMPIWGDLFRRANEDQMVMKVRVHNLINYLKAIQR
jgi:mono/diheme cytochrome c family protein